MAVQAIESKKQLLHLIHGGSAVQNAFGKPYFEVRGKTHVKHLLADFGPAF